MTTSIITFNNKEISVIREKGGFSIPSQKRFGEIFGIKGKELKRQHFNFKLEVGKLWNGEIAKKTATDEILAQRIIPTKHGFKVDYIETKNLNVPDVKSATKVAKETLLVAANKLVNAGKFSTVEEAIAFLA